MKLRTKMKVAFVIMSIMPIVLCAIAIAFILQREVNSIKKTYGITGEFSVSDIYAPSAILGGITEKTYRDIREVVEEDKDIFNDRKFIDELSNALKNKFSYLIVVKEKNIVYSSAPYTTAQLQELLPTPQVVQNLGNTGIYKGGSYQCLVKAISFTDSSHSQMGVYIITPMRQIIPEFRKLMIEAFIIIIEVIVFTGFILYFWINRSFVKPIDRLRLGTRNIKNGNLDFEIRATTKDELGDLCNDFEDMRIKLKNSKDEKEKADIEEKELIRNISHDLKTPLTSIKGYVEGLIDGIATTKEKQDKYLATIANKVSDMDRLIDELTLFSRLDTNRIPYDFVKINVKDYFDDCVSELKLDMVAQDIELRYTFSGNSNIEMMADPNQFKRVINNIISNSVKYKASDRPCKIEVSVVDESDYIHILIADNGVGIAMKDLSRIFDRFYRTDESRTSPQSGSGIGLAIVKKIIEDHKGRIWVDSLENHGTTFHINLLRYKEDMVLSLPDNQMKTSKRSKYE